MVSAEPSLSFLFLVHQCVEFLSGSAAYPREGTTNLHLDMSDAVNVMVCMRFFLICFIGFDNWLPFPPVLFLLPLSLLPPPVLFCLPLSFFSLSPRMLPMNVLDQTVGGIRRTISWWLFTFSSVDVSSGDLSTVHPWSVLLPPPLPLLNLPLSERERERT